MTAQPFRLWQLTPDRAAEWRAIRLEALRIAPEAFGSSIDDWDGRPLADFAARLAGCEVWAAGPARHAPGRRQLGGGDFARRAGSGLGDVGLCQP